MNTQKTIDRLTVVCTALIDLSARFGGGLEKEDLLEWQALEIIRRQAREIETLKEEAYECENNPDFCGHDSPYRQTDISGEI